ncbi:MAG: hypothetical protein V3W18_00010 [candidate division Zixibacteria bacterium]
MDKEIKLSRTQMSSDATWEEIFIMLDIDFSKAGDIRTITLTCKEIFIEPS